MVQELKSSLKIIYTGYYYKENIIKQLPRNFGHAEILLLCDFRNENRFKVL